MAEGITITANIDARDLYKLAKRMDVVPAFKDGVKASAVYVKGVLAEYPDATDANVPGPYPKRWYVRGKGPHWALKGGGVHFSRTSEILGKRWTIVSVDDGLGAIIGNNASYGPYVQSREHQQRWHKAHGWQTVEDVVDDESEKVVKIIGKFIEAAINRK